MQGKSQSLDNIPAFCNILFSTLLLLILFFLFLFFFFPLNGYKRLWHHPGLCFCHHTSQLHEELHVIFYQSGAVFKHHDLAGVLKQNRDKGQLIQIL